ncbi:MAG: flagellar M-ring protein FliF, partial [Sphingomonadales bacterium]|nr:flagellar M-ring protein FliF [Sphingomonadales bacterium]
ERNLFRGARGETRAAVTVVPRQGRRLDEARVAGIQRLVASSVPELALANVVVLDDAGRVISAAPSGDEALPPALAERSAAQAYYRARIRSAVEQVVPQHRFDIRVAVIGADEAAMATGSAPPAANAEGASGRRQFRLRVTFLSSEPIAAEQQAEVLAAARRAADLDEQLGDHLVFAVGPTDFAPVPAAAPRPFAPAAAAGPGPEAASTAPPASGWWPSGFQLAIALALLLALLLFRRSREGAMPQAEREAFIDRLRAELSSAQEHGHA